MLILVPLVVVLTRRGGKNLVRNARRRSKLRRWCADTAAIIFLPEAARPPDAETSPTAKLGGDHVQISDFDCWCVGARHEHRFGQDGFHVSERIGAGLSRPCEQSTE